MGRVTFVTAYSDGHGLRARDYAHLQQLSLPSEPWQWLREWIVITNDEVPLRSGWPFRVVRPPDPPGQWPPYDLALKLLFPQFGRYPILWLDGDIVITRDPTRHLVNYFWASRSGIDRWWAGPSRLNAALGGEIDLHSATDCGVMYLPREPTGYQRWLTDFFAVPSVAKMMASGGGKARIADQLFWSVVLREENARLTRGGSVVGKVPPTDPLYGTYAFTAEWPKVHRYDRHFPPATFVHYNCGRHKPEAYEKYLDWLSSSNPVLIS